jgi:plastocyanin
MKRFSIALLIALLTTNLAAAELAGKVAFVTKRGQKPVLAETLVWLEPLSATRATRKPAANYQMLTRAKTLLPHVLAIPAGSTVQFPNDDPISHNLFSLSAGSTFDLGLYRRGPGKSHRFDTPGIVTVYCNVHPNMSAVIHVMPTAYYTLADAAGNYRLTDVAPGKYQLVAWNEQGGTTESAVEVLSTGAVQGNAALTIDSRTYRAVQHANKEGKPYDTSRPRDY